MSLTKEETAAQRAAFQKMSLAGKTEYIFTYFKLPILLGLIALYLVCSAAYRQITKKEVILYTAHINISAGDELEARLTGGFLSASGANPKRTEIDLSRDSICRTTPPWRTTNISTPPA